MIATRPAGCSVFLVEDEVMIRMMVADMLEELGHTVAAEAGEIGEAVKLVHSTEFDIAILDVNVNGKVITPVAELITARDRLRLLRPAPGISRPPRPAEAIPTGDAGPGHRLHVEGRDGLDPSPHIQSSSSAKADDPVFRDLRLSREAAAYWIPAFAGMTLRVTSTSSSALPRMLHRCDRAAAA